ncbi:MAG: putative Ig domain-containing protein [Fidelibacterota bacterium]
MRRPAFIVIFLSLLGGYSNALANTAPYFTGEVADTNLTEDVYWSTWLMAADDDEDPLSYNFANDVPAGMTINTTSGRITWTPDNDAVGTHRILASVSDGSLTAYLEFFLHVQNVNDPPFWVNTTDDTVTVAEDSELELTVTANDDDLPHGDHITYSIIRGDNVNINPVTGRISGSPDNSNVGFQTITVRARDDSTAAIEWSFVLEVLNTPVVFTNMPPIAINEDDPFGFDLNADDEGQGNTVYYFQSGFQPEWMGIDATTGYISGIPNNLHVGTETVKIVVDDDNGSTDTLSYELTVINRKPVITSPTLHYATEDVHFALDIHADDEGLGTTTYQFLDDLEPHPDWLSLRTNDGVISGTPNNTHVGTNSFYLEFHDGHDGKDTTQFVINVANVPVVIDSTNLIYAISEDQEYYYKFTSSDDGQGTVTYHGINLPDWLAINLYSGVLRGTPNNEDVGDYNLSIYVSDGTDSDTVDFTIHVENRLPQLESSPVASVEEDNPYTYDIDYDDEGEGAVYRWLIQPAWLSLNPSTGVISGTPDNSDVGEHVISVQVDDGNSGIVSHTFTVTVINRNPVFTPQADTTVTQYELLTIDLDTDDEGDPQVTYEILEAPEGAEISPNDGIFSWTPANAQVGTHAIRISGTDNHGGASTFDFSVTVLNSIPVISSSPPLTATEDANYYYDVQCNEEGDGDVSYSLTTAPDWLSIDADAGILQGVPGNPEVGAHLVTVRVNDGNGGFTTQSWTITVQNINPSIVTEVLDPATEDSAYSFQIDYIPANQGDHTFSIVGDKPGWLSINALNGRLSGTPTNSEVGSDSIMVKIADDYGGYDQKRLEIVVNNSLPLFTTTDDVTITEDEALSWDIDTNDEGDEGSGTSGYNLVEAPDWLSINATTGELTGTPVDDDVGAESLTIRYQDGNGGIVTLNLNLIVVNNPPTITSLSPTATAIEGVNYSFQFTSDDDNWNPTYTSAGELPANINLTTDGLLSGIPLNAVVGNHAINIIVTDNNGEQDNLGFTLSVANAAPTITGYTVSNPKSTVVDTVYITEDIAYTIDFSADDEADGAAALYTINHKPGWLTTTSTVNGTLAGTPDNRHVGLDYVDVTFNDGNGGSDNMRFYLRVQNVAPAFIDAPASLTATEDAEFYYDLNSSDEGQGTITYSITAGDLGWLTLDATSGEISGTPDNDDVADGTDVTFRVTDGNGGAATKTIVFIVGNTNDNPTWISAPVAGSTVTTAEDAGYSLDIDAGDVDVDDNLTYSLTTNPTGMTINSTTGVINWTPDNSQVGDHPVTVRVEDENSAAITRSWTVRVTNIVSPITHPATDDFTPSIAVTAVADTFYLIEDTTYTLDLSAPDEGVGAVSSYSFDEFPNPGWITLSNAVTGLVSLTPTNSAVGLDSFLVYFKDQPASRDTITIYLSVENIAPEILTEGPFSATEGIAFSRQLQSSDDGDGTLTWSFVSGKPGWLEIDANSGELSGTPQNADVISDASFIVQVNDGNGGVTQKSFDYSVENVNTPPSITVVPGGIITITEDVLYTTDVDASDADAGDVLSYSLNTAPTGMTINATTGVIQWTPTNAQVGTHTVTVKVTDSESEFASSSWQLQVQNMNDPPEWVSVPSGTIQTDEEALYSVTLQAEDIDSGDHLTYSLLANPDGMTIDANTGLIEWTPDNDDVGLHDISVRAVDDSAAAITAGWTLEVRNVNDTPVWTSVPTGTITSPEDALYTTDVDAIDADAGDVITYSLTQSPLGMTINATIGVISWTPDNSQVGNHSITIRATDLAGAFVSQTFTLQVTNVASPIAAPVAGDFTPSAAVTVAADTFFIKEDTVYTLNLTVPDEGVGTASSYSFDDFPNPDWVSLADAASGLVTLTPTNGSVGLDSFLVYFRDQPGSRDTLTVYLRVENVAPEILTEGPFTATEGVEFSQQLQSSDDGDGTLTWSFVSGKPGWLEIDANRGELSGTPENADVISDASFVIRVDDGNGGSAQKTFDYSVININNSPVWTAVPEGVVTVNEDNLYSVTIAADDSDLDHGDMISYSLVNPPAGMIINSASGVITWIPDNSHVGANSVTVKATDLESAVISANFTVNVFNSPPVIAAPGTGDFAPAGVVTATADTFFIWEDSSYTVDFTADDEGLGGATVYRISGLANPDWVSLTNATAGVAQLTPLNRDVGLDSIRIVFDDGYATDTAQVYIRIRNSAPEIITAGPFYATQDEPFEAELESTDADELCRYSFVGIYPDWMSINASSGLISGIPDNDAVGTFLFTVRIDDGNGGSADQSYTIHVANTNDPPAITSVPITTVIEDESYVYHLSAIDPDGDPLTYYLITKPAGMTIDAGSGMIRWIPDNNFSGLLIPVKAGVADTSGAAVEQSWNISVANAPPNFLTAFASFDAIEDSEFSFDLDVDDEGQGVTSYMVIHLPGWMTLLNSVTGLIGGTPDNSYVNSSDSVYVEFSDGNGGRDTLNLPVTVANVAPVFSAQPDTSVTEGSSVLINLDCDDEFAGGVSYTAPGGLPAWLSLNATSGVLSGSPGNAAIGAYNISIRATDASGGFTAISFQITVVNGPPEFTGVPLTAIEEDSLYEYTPDLVDPSGDNIFSLLTNPGWLTINGSTGMLSGTPLNQHVGDNTVSMKVDDGLSASDTLDFVITVVNTAPVITTVPPTAGTEDLLYSVNINCSDEGQGTMIYTALQKPGWLSLNPNTGLLRGTPMNQHVSSGDSIEIMVNDGNGGFDTLRYSLAIANRGPSFTQIFSDTTITEDDMFSFDIDSDDEGQGATSYSFINEVPDWINLDTETGLLSGTPLNQHVASSVGMNVKVDDGNGGSRSQIFTITVLNNPVRFISAITDSIATQGELFSYDADTDDEAQGNGVYTFVGLPAWLNGDDTTGVLGGTPGNDDVDTSAITIRFNDGNGSIVEQMIHVIVENANDAPWLTATATQDTIYEDSLWTFRFFAQDIDSVYGDMLSFELQAFPSAMEIDSASGIVSWTPQNDAVGDVSFEIWVFDKARASDSLTFRLHILNTNDPPQIIAQADTIAREDELFSYTIRYVDMDAGDSLRFELHSSPLLMEIDSINGRITWTPDNNDREQSFEIIYSVTDSSGETDLDTFNVFVENVNDAPVLAVLDEYTFSEDSSLIIQISDWFDRVTDIDDPDSALSWQVTSFNTVVAVVRDDSLLLTAPQDWFGLDTGEVVVSDGELSDTTQLIVFVLPVNDPPVIAAEFPALITFDEDDSTILNLNDYVSDVDNSDLELNWSVEMVEAEKSTGNEALSKSESAKKIPPIKSYSVSARRSLLVNSNGDSISIDIDPETNLAKFYAQPNFFIDGFGFRFIVNDSTDGADFGCDSVITTIRVEAVNDAPVLATLPELNAVEDSTITVVLSDWFEFVSDVDNPDTTLIWTIIDGNYVSGVIVDSILSIIPLENWFGKDTLQIIASDDELLSDTADVIVHYQPVNDAPVFSPIPAISFPEDDTFYVHLNDYAADVETPDDDLVFGFFRVENTGSASTSLKYRRAKPAVEFTGIKSQTTRAVFYDTFSSSDSIIIEIHPATHIATISGAPNYYTPTRPFGFTVSDGEAADTVTVMIAIQPVNDKPVLDSLPPIVFVEDNVFRLSLSEWDSLIYDVEDPNDSLRWVFSTQGPVTVQYDSLLRQITLSAPENFYGSDVLTAVVSDRGGLSDTMTIAMTVLPFNDPPQIDSSLFAITFDQKDTVEYQLDIFVSDRDHDVRSMQWRFHAGEFVCFDYTDTSRWVRFWTDPDRFGIDSLLAIVTDPLGGADSQYLKITVTDTTEPTFELAIFQNQLASRFVEIDVFPSELLADRVLIITDGDTLPVLQDLDADSVMYYNATYQIEKTGIVQIRVEGIDRAGNPGDYAYQIGVSRISRETGGSLTGPDSIMSFLFAAEAVPMDLCALFIPYKAAIRPDTALAKGMFGDADFPVSDEFDFRIPVASLADNARIMFNLENMQFLQQYAAYLGVYRLENGEWRYLKTYTSLEKGSYWAYTKKPGVYQIRVNSANPAVILPEQFSVRQNYPNPFNSQTTICYTIGAGGFVTFEEAFEELVAYDVSIKIYNLLGQEVATLLNKPQLPGHYSITWNGRNNYGKTVATGFYIYQVIIGNRVFHKKMTVLK